LDRPTHEAYQKDLEKQWHSRFAEQQHHDLVQTPSYLSEDALQQVDVNVCTNVEDDTLSPAEKETAFDSLRAQLREDGATFKKKYYADFQSIFSRVQHHMHKKTKKGKQSAVVASRSNVVFA